MTDGAMHWYGLGPVAGEPAVQRQGIGSALVNAGRERLRILGAAGCVVVGDPAYYGRFGFTHVGDLVYPGASPEYFLAPAFGGSFPHGEVAYHVAFARGT